MNYARYLISNLCKILTIVNVSPGARGEQAQFLR